MLLDFLNLETFLVGGKCSAGNTFLCFFSKLFYVHQCMFSVCVNIVIMFSFMYEFIRSLIYFIDFNYCLVDSS